MSELPHSGDAGEPTDDDLAGWLLEEMADQDAMEEDLARSQRLLAQMASQLNAEPSGPSAPPGLDEDAMLEMYVEAEDDEAAMPGATPSFPGFDTARSGATPGATGIDLDAFTGLDDLEDFDFTDFEEL